MCEERLLCSNCLVEKGEITLKHKMNKATCKEPANFQLQQHIVLHVRQCRNNKPQQNQAQSNEAKKYSKQLCDTFVIWHIIWQLQINGKIRMLQLLLHRMLYLWLHLSRSIQMIGSKSTANATTIITKYIYEGCAINSRTVLLSKQKVTAGNQNYYEVVWPLLYITYCGFIYDVTLQCYYY